MDKNKTIKDFFNLEITKDFNNNEDGVFSGKLVTYGNIDRQQEVIDSSAFDDVTGKEFPLLFDHNYSQGIGYFKVTNNDEQQLTIEGHFNLNDDYSNKIYQQVKFGTYTNLSVGFRVLDYYFDSNDILHITKGDLLEGSVVPVPANKLATIDIVKDYKLEKESKKMPENKKKVESKETEISTKQLSENIKQLSDTITKGFKQITDNFAKKQETENVEKKQPVEIKKSFKNTDNNSLKSYLDSDQAVKDYYDVITKSYQEGYDGKLSTAWKNNLHQKDFSFSDNGGNAIDLPTQVIKTIQQKVESHKLYQYFAKLNGVDHYSFLIGSTNDKAATHKPGTQKKNSTEALRQVDVTADFVYKYVEANRKMMVDSNTAIITVQWLVGQLADAIVAYIEEAAIKGQDDNTSFQPVLKSKLLAQPADYAGATTGEATLEDLSKAINFVKNKANASSVVLIGSNATISNIRFAKDKNGAYLLNSAFSEPDKLLGYPTVDIDLGDKVVVLANNAYSVLQKTGNIESFTNFKLDTNTNQFLSEIYAGGALTTMYGAAVVGNDAKATK